MYSFAQEKAPLPQLVRSASKDALKVSFVAVQRKCYEPENKRKCTELERERT